MKKWFKAEDKRLMPVKIEGKTIYIGKEPVELDESKFDYTTKIHIKDAIKKKDISIVSKPKTDKPNQGNQ